MYPRQTRRNPVNTKKPPKLHYKRFVVFVIAAVIVWFSLDWINNSGTSAIPEIRSGIAGYCLDDHHDNSTNGATVDSWSCNGRDSQNWVAINSVIKHDSIYCLSVKDNGTSSGDAIVINKCDGSSGQVWVSAIGGYENPVSAKCLSVPNNQTNIQLQLSSCNNLTTANEMWRSSTWSKNASYANSSSLACSGSEGQIVACYAAKEWTEWQSGTVSHSALLNKYSDGNGYEEWCADFVSYVYKEAGYPFSNGERSGWDEYLADNIQYQGFTYHSASSGYVPQTGDVAFFDYSGGHVEIVAIGGTKPLFIYGDSGTTDPTTGNGEMTENTITNDGLNGQVIYYLSPS